MAIPLAFNNPFTITIIALGCAFPYRVIAQIPSTSEIEEVQVVGKNQRNTIASPQAQKLLKAAGTIGDPIQAVFTLPGVVQVDEEDPEPAIRGSSPNANLFLVDNIPVDFLFHPFGNSIFNENLIQDFGLKAAGFGAKYGKATGAVFDVNLRNPKNQPLEFIVDLSFLRAGVMVEGATKDNQSFYFSYRESLIQLFLDAEDEEEDIRFINLPRSTDYQGKYFWGLNQNSAIILQWVGARDKASADFGKRSEDVLLDPGMEGKALLDTEFHSLGLTWNHSNSNVTLAHTLEQSNQKIGNGDFLDLTEYNWILKGEHEWLFNHHRLLLGANLESIEYDYDLRLRLERCSDFSPNCEFNLRDTISLNDTQKVNTYETYLQDNWQIGNTFELIYGLHYTHDDYLKESHIDPRISAQWQLNNTWALNTSIGQYHQSPEVDEIFPTIGNPQLTSISSTHYVLGVNHNSGNSWSWNMDLYYKDIKDLVVDTNNDAEPFFNNGSGKAYGLEFMVNKELTDRWYGWATLSLSKTERTNKLTGKTTPFSYDTPIVANLVLNYQWTTTWNAGLRWTYRSGTVYTPIIGNRENPRFPEFYIPVYGELNSERAPAYHRLDLRLERSFTGSRKGFFYIDIINLYNRSNTSGIEYEPIPDSSEFKLTEKESFGFFPSIGVKYIF